MAPELESAFATQARPRYAVQDDSVPEAVVKMEPPAEEEAAVIGVVTDWK